MATSQKLPHIVGIGGTTVGTSTETSLRLALQAAEQAGATTLLIGGPELSRLPHYLALECEASEVGRALIKAIRSADGLIIASPGYHGSISGLVKNAMDYVEETAKDPRPYLDGLPVGLIATAAGWQATASTLAALRAIVHALRGWPTPLGATINTSGGIFSDGACSEPVAAKHLELVGRQVVEFARLKMCDPLLTET